MELILISNSKLKIMLSAEDMKEYNIECEGGCALRQGLAPVLERARLDCGFDTASGRLLVQVFPSRKGGCEMFVTRVAQKNEREARAPASVCLFDSLGDMTSLCGVLKARGIGEMSSAYRIGERRYALVLPELDRDEALPLSAAVISEFGERCECENVEGYINEHATPIFKNNAVALLADFA